MMIKLSTLYLEQVSRHECKVLFRFRTSTHPLPIETGRHKQPVIPPSERKCNKCSSNVIGDEYHLFNCDKFKNEAYVFY